MMELSLDAASQKMMKKLGPNMEAVRTMTLQRTGLEAMNGAKEAAPYITGNLRRSITMEPQKVGKSDLKVEVGSNLVYARIQDMGGEIVPKSAQYLRFQVKGQWVMARRVKIKGNKYLTKQYERMSEGRMGDIFKEESERNIFKK